MIENETREEGKMEKQMIIAEYKRVKGLGASDSEARAIAGFAPRSNHRGGHGAARIGKGRAPERWTCLRCGHTTTASNLTHYLVCEKCGCENGIPVA